ncbi:hypothetical protein QEZ54_33045 [Catellatospora sp. KI3]|uniref:hypothetical protein n=1 Tax=Catellatospora sp. KI3 TaxID=3041620 RepID=UPI0024822AB7|nr:hypothetical protein [Catellatospora sp. KI3]MDI1465810.1 hypothetical protein [Catellatospora sp. KI3]
MGQPSLGPYDPAAYAPITDGFLPPDDAFAQAAPVTGAEDDPLVNPAAQGVAGWTHRVGGVLRRGWPLLLGIFALTQLLPSLLFKLLVVLGATGVDPAELALLARRRGELMDVLMTTLLVYSLVVVTVRMLGYAAATYVAVRQADHQPVGFGSALLFGLRRFVPLSLWHLLAYLLIGAACIMAVSCFGQLDTYFGLLIALLLAAYLYFSVAFLGPAYLFERKRAMSRSRTLTHGRFGRTLGRLSLLGLLLLAVAVLEPVLAVLAVAAGLDEALPYGVPDLCITLVVGLVSLPLTMIQFGGVLVSYAEARASEDPRMRTSVLAAELS